MINLETNIININRVGAATAKKLKKLGINTARDLLFYFPFRYDDFSKITDIANLRAGMSANVVGQIELIQNKRSARRGMNITEALVSDQNETLKVIWFNQPFIAKVLKVGDHVSLAGKIENDYGGVVMMSPVYEKINPPSSPLLKGAKYNPPHPLYQGGINAGSYGAVHTQGFVPNYHLTANLTHKQVRFLIKEVIGLADKITDWLPLEVKKNIKAVNINEAIKKVHFPKSGLDIRKARERLAFDELFLIQLQSRLIRKSLSALKAPSVEFKEKETKEFVASLPFKLTNAQRKAAWEIIKDMGKDQPMSRLLEGEVGSGKTLVAIIAMLNVALNKKQAVLMVPTEILARQHFDTVSRLLAGLGIKVGLVTGNQRAMNYESRIMNNGENKKNNAHDSLFIIHNSDIIIGTHALIQEDVKFRELALAIIDEQHRFGVEQRAALLSNNSPTKHAEEFNPPQPPFARGARGLMPHLLSMTATPIPRSLALALYGDLDLSIINEMPKDRKKIVTRVVKEEKRPAAYNFIREQIKQGRQAFVICPLIDPSDKMGVKSVEEEYDRLKKIIFPDLAIEKLHGRLKAKDKESVMRRFLENKINILISTSVVEVGVDAPNAAVMMIEGADRFGLAQLHQFRGRVGRSEHQSYCLLFTASLSDRTLKRLEALVECHDGFSLAKLDLKFRGPGEVYGEAQKGFPELKMASLFDYALMKQAREQAIKLLEINPSLDSWPSLKEKLGEWEKNTHLE